MRGSRWLKIALLLAAVFVVLAVVDPQLAWAGPGGVFVKAAAKTLVGQIVLGVLGVLFLPLVLWVFIGQALGIRRTRRELEQLAAARPEFAWEILEREARQAIEDVYQGWQAGALEEVADRMTPEYFASQAAVLERWEDEGKQNVVKLHLIRKLSPLYVRTESRAAYSVVALLVAASVTDYLEELATGKILKGSKTVDHAHESVWLFAHRDGQWRVTRIEEGRMSFSFAKMKNEIDPALLTQLPASQPALAQAPQHEPAAKHESTPKQVPDRERHG
jgi:inner membrane protein import complex subunit Tim44-like protein